MTKSKKPTNANVSVDLLDRPEITRRIFFPRQDGNPAPATGNIESLHLQLDADLRLSARFHFTAGAAPNVLFFHGNGEVASDYDDIGPILVEPCGINLMVVDYRGYGSSTGVPTISNMLGDAPGVYAEFRAFLQRKHLAGPVILMGRSLGSAPAIEIATRVESDLAGLVIESGFARVSPLLDRLGVPSSFTRDPRVDANSNLSKIETLSLPALVIHGARDHIIPVQHGHDLHEHLGTPADQKELVVIPRAGHNTILMYPEYMRALQAWLARWASKGPQRNPVG